MSPPQSHVVSKKLENFGLSIKKKISFVKKKMSGNQFEACFALDPGSLPGLTARKVNGSI